MTKFVFAFNDSKPKNSDPVFLLGNKGAQLAEMTSIGLPVPKGFTISTEACRKYYASNKSWPRGLKDEIRKKVEKLEKETGKSFGSVKFPLLVSVRSGSFVSMPGMMDSVLNIGLNDSTVLALAESTGSECGAWDSYRRFLQMFGDVVLHIGHSEFENILEKIKGQAGAELDSDLSVEDLKKVVEEFKKLYEKEKKRFPSQPLEQLNMAITAVFDSWNISRAVAYRKLNRLPDDAGTAVNVQEMVFGNLGNDCATGVSFTRNPSTGKKEHYGEFLVNAQGEDVVAGIRTPKPIDDLKKLMPKVFEELVKVYDLLEKHYKDMQDFEFTIEKEKLFILQTRAGKRTAQAAVKIAVDMQKEGLISEKQAVLLVNPNSLIQLLHKCLDEIAKRKAEFIAKGLPASPGAAIGRIVFSSEKAQALTEVNPSKELILVRTETSPEDIEGMAVAKGVLTTRGGITSHAAVVARGMGKCCIVGCEDLFIKSKEKKLVGKNILLSEGDWITLDGSTGEVFKGKVPVVDPELGTDFKKLMSWADRFRKLKVRVNADNETDALKAKEFGAEGIGLCRTEHMFFAADRINSVREMILAETTEERERALKKILPMQKKDFIELFKAMNGLPVTIRLLDPPLHEFLPKEELEIEVVAREMEVSPQRIEDKVKALHEQNPMLGHRGCRLGLTFPEIIEMQATAVFRAALECKRQGVNVLPEIEIPLIVNVLELRQARKIIEETAEKTSAKNKVKCKIGAMIELPRACIVAGEIAKEADFLSFGTNDLTQTVFGFSRDDVAKFLPKYIEKGLLEVDPFHVIDRKGVGELMKLCVKNARKSNKKIEIGICGEHGGEAESIEFCNEIGLDYVSCSPFRIPIARLAAAHAALKEK